MLSLVSVPNSAHIGGVAGPTGWSLLSSSKNTVISIGILRYCMYVIKTDSELLEIKASMITLQQLSSKTLSAQIHVE